MERIKRLFTIKTKFEAFLVIYALALGATERGLVYIQQYPGFGGKLLALACTCSVFMAGGMILDAVDMRRRAREPDVSRAKGLASIARTMQERRHGRHHASGNRIGRRQVFAGSRPLPRARSSGL